MNTSDEWFPILQNVSVISLRGLEETGCICPDIITINQIGMDHRVRYSYKHNTIWISGWRNSGDCFCHGFSFPIYFEGFAFHFLSVFTCVSLFNQSMWISSRCVPSLDVGSSAVSLFCLFSSPAARVPLIILVCAEFSFLLLLPDICYLDSAWFTELLFCFSYLPASQTLKLSLISKSSNTNGLH